MTEAAQASSSRRSAGLRKTSRNASRDSFNCLRSRRTWRRMAAGLVYLKGRREDSGQSARLVRETGDLPTPSGRRSSMSEERTEQERPEGETEDVEAHHRIKAMTDEPAKAEEDEGGDDVEAHRRR